MRPIHTDRPPSATRGDRPSAAVIRLHRAKAVVRTRNSPASAPPVAGSSGRARGLLGLLSAVAVTILPLMAPDVAHAERKAAVEVAMVTDLAGRVERQPPAITEWSRVGLDEAVALFDAMRTWESSTAELRFVDGTVVMLDEKTRLRISPMLFDPSQAPQEVQLALAAGAAEIRAGNRRLWVDTGDGEPTAIEPGSKRRVTAAGDGSVGIGVPAMPTTSDFERGAAPGDGARGPAAEDPDAQDPGPGDQTDGPGPSGDGPRPFDPTDGRPDPTEVVDQVVDTVPGSVAVDVRLPGGAADDPPADDGGILFLPAPLPDRMPDGMPEQMPDQLPEQMPPDMPLPEIDGLPTLPGGPDGLLRDLVPDGIVTGLDDLPPAPTTGRVRVEVEIRRR